MKPESPENKQDGMVSPYMQEIEYALILSRMIDTVQEDPAQLRATIYEFARAKLDVSGADESQRARQAAALETAIQGVEAFSARRGRTSALELPAPATGTALRAPPAQPASPEVPQATSTSMSMATVRNVTPAADD